MTKKAETKNICGEGVMSYANDVDKSCIKKLVILFLAHLEVHS